MNRRVLLERIVQGFTATGLAFLAYPFIKAWLPGHEEELGIEIRVDDLEEGEYKLIRWLGRRVFVQRRTVPMMEAVAAPGVELKDPESLSSVQPAKASNAFRSIKPEIFVAFSNCTHLGCEVDAVTERAVGFTCPCHQSDFDHAGRVLVGAAAPRNLDVPDYRFVSGSVLRLEALSS